MGWFEIPFVRDWGIQIGILVGGIIAAWVAMKIMGWAASKIATRTLSSLDERILRAVEKPMFFAIVILAAYLVAGHFSGREMVPPSVKAGLERFLFVAAALVGSIFVGRVVGTVFRWYSEEITARAEVTLSNEFLPLIKRVFMLFIYVLAIIIVLGRFGINISALVATLGVTSFAIAFATQDTLSNMISGLMIMLDRPFKVGDRIRLATGEKGDVVEIGIRTTRIQNSDGNLVVVPNSELNKSRVVNMAYPNRRTILKVLVEVGSTDDIEKVRGVLSDVASSIAEIDTNPRPIVLLLELTPASLKFLVVVTVRDFSVADIVRDRLGSRLIAELKEEGIEVKSITRFREDIDIPIAESIL
ncbi:MAG: mechanosensitive ion channel family protein [bacterium]